MFGVMKDLKSKIYSWVKKSKKQKYSSDPARQDYLDGYNDCLKDLELFLNLSHIDVGDYVTLTEDVEGFKKGRGVHKVVNISYGSKQIQIAAPEKSPYNVISLHEHQYTVYTKLDSVRDDLERRWPITEDTYLSEILNEYERMKNCLNEKE